MDILNFISWIAGKKRVVSSVPDDSLIPVGVRNPQRGDLYTTVGIKKSDLIPDATCPMQLSFKEGSVGPKVSFKKKNFGNEKDIIIPGVLEIARGNDQGLYNAAIDNGWNNPGPTNTIWSSPNLDPSYENFAPLYDLINRSFGSWIDAINSVNNGNEPAIQVGMPMVMIETTTGRLWIIIFTEWSVGEINPGGGFAYDRWEILSSINFEKPNYQTSTVDKISDGVWIARGNNSPIYNAAVEDYYTYRVSPFNTRWNSSYNDTRSGYSGFSDLSNLEDRYYSDIVDALGGSEHVGSNIVGTELIMHDLTTDVYHTIEFSSWTSGNNGGGFAYKRQAIPQSCPIKFADGTVLTTAPTGTSGTTCCPTIDNEGNTILDDIGTNLLAIGPGAGHLIPDFSGMAIINDHYSGRIETWIAGSGDAVLVSYTAVGSGVPTSTMTMSGSGYVWTNNDNLKGPFTIAVIKTRQGS